MTAAQRIAEALKSNATITVDHTTRKFVGYAIDMNDRSRPVVVRVHIDSIENKALSAQV